ncbi:hypothetical protein GGF43_005478, partial [Coemansia sp. RSA 2618]
MSHKTPKRFESRDFYQRPGQHSTSTEKEKKRLDAPTTQFFTNLTSVNIATAFARAHITSETIRRRPAHLKGTPMSPSQIPRMNLADIPDEHDPHAHFESAAAPRSHGVRPVRDITSKNGRGGQPSYEQMDIDTPGFAGDTNGALGGGFLRERNWDAPTAAAPGWLRRIQDRQHDLIQDRQHDLLHESPPHNLVNTPSHTLNRGAAPSFEPLTDNLIDLRTPHNEDNAGAVYARNGSGHAYTNAATAERAGRAGSAALAASASADYNGDTTSDMPGALNRYARPRGASRAAAGKTGGANGYGDAGGQDEYEADPHFEAAEYARSGAGRTPRAQSHYSLRSHISTPGRLSYDHDFNPHEAGHDQYTRRPSDAGSRRSMPVPTPYTARIKGPGAFPGTAQRFSQRRPSARGASAGDGELSSPTGGRRPGARTASGNMALTEGDLLANHRYLAHGSAAHRGWGEYAQNDEAERETVRSFSDSFISNSTAGGDAGAGEYERDNPTLVRRLLRNIAAGWSGSSGSLAERVSFVFFMVYFLVKETCLVLGTFLVRLAFNFVIGPVYTGIREVVMLPASLWQVLAPGSSHDVAGAMRGILTGLSMVALSIVAAQYGQSVFSGLGSLP